MQFQIFKSHPDSCSISPYGWIAIKDREYTIAPVFDDANGSLARLDCQQSWEFAEKHNAQLLTLNEAMEYHQAATFPMTPIIIRETEEEKAERKNRGGKNTLERMATREWAQRFDDSFWGQVLDAGKWDKMEIPACLSAGKTWLRGASPKECINFGMISKDAPNKFAWQPASKKHNSQHTDYSQILLLSRKLQTK